ncbi:hypothetical protein K438DRAFT_727086 [Mycena galopus ATCC 62051]|nr:hypothetical protein K438DRAFT_727086 [Mycena galopus ATCC 62051]
MRIWDEDCDILSIFSFSCCIPSARLMFNALLPLINMVRSSTGKKPPSKRPWLALTPTT